MTTGGPSAAWFEKVLDAMEEFVLVKGDRSRLLWANRAFRQAYGLTNEALKDLIDGEHSDPDDTLQYVRDDHQVFTTGKPLSVTEPVTFADGTVRYVNTRKTAIVDASGNVQRTVGVSRLAKGLADIAASETTRDTRKTTATVLRAVVSALPLPVLLLDAQRRVAAASLGFKSLMGRDNLAGEPLESVVPGADDILIQSVERVTAGSGIELLKDFSVASADRIADVHVQSWQLPDDTVGGTLLTFNDVTALREEERKLREANKKLEQRASQLLEQKNQEIEKARVAAAAQRDYLSTILEVLPTGVAAVDSKGAFTLYNPEMARLLARRAPLGSIAEWQDQLGLCDQDEKPLPPEEMPLVKAQRAISTDNELLFMPAPNNHTVDRWIRTSAIPLPDGGALAVMVDLTDRVKLQNELEEFAYVTSHDLHEPARMVRSFLQLLEKEAADKLEGKAMTYLTFAKDGAIRMQQLIDDLLAFSRTGSLAIERRPLDLGKIVKQVRTNLAGFINQRKAEFTVADPLPTIKADRSAIVQVITNLIANALKFTEAGATPMIEISASEQKKSWRISVRDHGIGVDKRYAERIFKMFQRLHSRDEYEGTGIGLSLCKRLVEKHHGQIGVDPAEPGSEFWFTIPH